jgi:hypothetical protein
MIAEVRIKLKAQKPKTNATTHKQFDTNKLKDRDIRRSFCISLHNKFEALNLLDEAEDSSVENIWTSVKSAYHDVAKARLGFKKRKKEKWISDDTWKCISKRKETRTLILNTLSPEQKAQLQLRYKEEDKAVKRSARKDKRNVIEEKAALAEEAAKKGDSKMVYRLTNEIVGKKTIRTSLVKDENEDVISDPQKADERWASHFEKVLNRPRPDDPEVVPDKPFLQIDVSADPPSTEEVSRWDHGRDAEGVPSSLHNRLDCSPSGHLE